MLTVKCQHVLVLANKVIVDYYLGQISRQHLLVIEIINIVQLSDHHAVAMLVQVLKALIILRLFPTPALLVSNHDKFFLVFASG